MSNKKLIKMLVVIFILVALIVTYVFVDRYKTRKEDEQAAKEADEQAKSEENYKLINLDTTDIIKITFNNIDAKCVFVYDSDSDTWSCDGKDWKINQEKVTTLLTASASISSTNELDEKSDLSEYGLDKPKLTVKLETKDGSSYSFLVGDSAISGSGNYFMMDGGENIYVVDKTLMDAYSYNESQFIEVEEIESLESNNIYYVNVDKKDGKDFSFYYDGDKTDDTVSGKFYITKPYKVPQLGDESEIYSYLSNYASLSYDECVSYKATDADKKKYGLDSPEYTVNFKYFAKEEADSDDSDSKKKNPAITHKEVTYYIGDSISEMTTDETTGEEVEKINSYYVMSSESDGIFLMAADAVEALANSDPFTCVLANINDTDINAYKNLTVTVGDKKYVLTKREVVSSDDDSKDAITDTYTVNKNTINEDVASTVYSDITDLCVSREISTANAKKKLVATFDYVAGNDTKDMAVEFYTYDDNFYSVKKDGGEYYLISKPDVDNVLDGIKGLTLSK